ncbi:MAG TPA: SGNH/GDSL hydrolase family protein [bacterium]|nr:SGNH/GDSL hydrolase family protein [bacterium]
MKTRTMVVAIALSVGVLLFLGSCATTETPLPDVAGETWDYVILGSSVGTWWAEYYGDSIESDLGVKLFYLSHYVGAQPVSGLLKNIRNDERLRGNIKKAEVITIGVGIADMNYAIGMYGAGGRNDRRRLKEELDTFRETYDSMLTELLSLTSPTDTIIRVMDFYYPNVGRDQEKGIYNQIKSSWQKFNKCIIQAARKRGIPVAKVFQAFHGPHGNDDPAEKGYLDKDGLHSSEEGKKIIAAEFQKLGYEYASP